MKFFDLVRVESLIKMATEFEQIVTSIKEDMGELAEPMLDLYLASAIGIYKDKKFIFNKNARAPEIAAIEKILLKELDPQKKIEEIQYLINHPDMNYRRGPMGNSKFADCINAAIYLYQCDIARFQRKQAQLEGTYSKDEIIQAYHGLSSKKSDIFEGDTTFYDQVLESRDDSNWNLSNVSADFQKLIAKAHQNVPSTGTEVRQPSKLGLKDYYLFGLQRYSDKVLKPSENRSEDIKALRNIIQKHAGTDADLSAKIHDYFNTPEFKKTARLGSTLKKCCLEAEQDFKKSKLPKRTSGNDQQTLTLTRTRLVRTWPAITEPKKPTDENGQEKKIEGKKSAEDLGGPEAHQDKEEIVEVAAAVNVPKPPGGRKVILAIHGLDDSVATWEGVAPQWAKAGYEVIAYDQASHGFDELRSKDKGLNLRQMQYDLYDQLRILQEDPTVDEIHLVGHSLGGALLANCLTTIGNKAGGAIVKTKPSQNDGSEPQSEKPNKIKSMTLISPAVMASAFFETIGNAWTQFWDPGNRGPGVEAIRRNEAALSRIGGDNVKGRLRAFIDFVGDAFSNLRMLASRRFEMDTEIPVYIMNGRIDKLVNRENFGILKFWTTLTQKKKSPVRIQEVNADHNPHALGSATDKLVGGETLKHIKASTEEAPKQNISNDSSFPIAPTNVPFT